MSCEHLHICLAPGGTPAHAAPEPAKGIKAWPFGPHMDAARRSLLWSPLQDQVKSLHSKDSPWRDGGHIWGLGKASFAFQVIFPGCFCFSAQQDAVGALPSLMIVSVFEGEAWRLAHAS